MKEKTWDLSSVLKNIWDNLYPDYGYENLDSFIGEIDTLKPYLKQQQKKDWYKDAVVYSLYVEQFNKDFEGLADKLDYLRSTGINCLWLLPILESPMRDAGFDISNFRSIRASLLGVDEKTTDALRIELFKEFLSKAKSKGISVIFDITINHTSDQHPWFLESSKDENNDFRDYYIWSNDGKLYQDVRIIFEGLCNSNWEKKDNAFYFHRFFEFQPDLNYRNPQVLIEMTRNFIFWMQLGVDGFRADAIPYLWKEEGSNCENLPETHLIICFFRAVLDYLRPGTLLLAEACQPPKEVVKYFGKGDECHAAYHFPLMPQIFKAIEMQQAFAIQNTLSQNVTPSIPDTAQWFTFLRCHDELSLELVYVSEEDRKFIHEHYCLQPEWDFRNGQGISARLSELMQADPYKILLAYSIMLSLPGTPVIYYGDEFGKQNDEAFYKEQIQLTGKDDTRFLVRGRINWEEVDQELSKSDSTTHIVYNGLKQMLNIRKKHQSFGRGEIRWVKNVPSSVLAFKRILGDEQILIIINLSEQQQSINSENDYNGKKLLVSQHAVLYKEKIILGAYGFCWLHLGNKKVQPK